MAARIAAVGNAIKREIDRRCARPGSPRRAAGPRSGFSSTFADPDPYRRRLKRTLYFQRLLEERIITVTGVMLPSYAHTEAIVERTVDAIGRVIGSIAEARARRVRWKQAIDIPLL